MSEAGLEFDDARREVLRRHARVIAAGSDRNTPLTPGHSFPPPVDLTPAQGLGILALVLLVVLSGFVNGRMLEWLGTRVFATVLLAVATGAAFVFRGNTRTGDRSLPAAERVLLVATLVFALLGGSSASLLLIPAIIHAAVARLMFASSTDDVSFIEMGARVLHPLAPDFIRPYCRTLTAVWGFAFAVSAGLTAALAVAGNTAAHRAWTGWVFWTLLGAFSAAEFVFRKAWFRNFGKGPLDRLLARIFPPEKTERGRKSQAYLLKMHAELARLAEAERTGRVA